MRAAIDACPSIDILMLRCIACCLRLLPSSCQWLGHALQGFLRGASTPSTMVHADVDVPGSRVSCVCSDSLLLMLSSTDAAETQPGAADHRPRMHSAAFCVVGVAKMLSLASFALLLVVLRGACGVLGRLGVLHVDCVGQEGRLLVRAGYVWCQYRTWAR